MTPPQPPFSDASIAQSKKAQEHDRLARELVTQAPVLAKIIKETVDEAADMTLEQVIECVTHQAAQVEVKLGQGARAPAMLEKNETGHIRADFVITLKLGEELYVRVNIEAQNKPHPGYRLGRRMQVYGSELITEQFDLGWVSGSNYDGLRKVYSIWLISNGPQWVQGRVFKESEPPLMEIGLDGKEFQPEAADEMAEKLGLRQDKFVCIAAYLPNFQNKVVCADWVRMLGTVLSVQATVEEREQAFRDNGIVLSLELEEKVKSMWSLYEGAVQVGRDQMAAQIAAQMAAARAETAAARAEADTAKSVVCRAARAMRECGKSVDDISCVLGLPRQEVQAYLDQEPDEEGTNRGLQ